jgi:hypothetical protein
MKTHGIPIILHDYLSTIDINELAADPELRKLYNMSIVFSSLVGEGKKSWRG